LADYRRRFDREHGRLYGYSNPARPTEVVAVRVRAAGVTDKPKLPTRRLRPAYRPAPASKRRATFGGRPHTLASYRWDDLAPGARASGPAVITGGEATVVVPPGARFKIDGFGNVVCEP
jgi:N-methylhydantoinase A/oxoprolinase/acetone carboxylase beta subunit